MKKMVFILLSAGIIIVTSLSVHGYLSSLSHSANTTEPASTPLVLGNYEYETVPKEEAEKIMEKFKAEEIIKISAFVLADEIFISNEKYLKGIESVIGHLRMISNPIPNEMEGEDLKYYVYGKNGLLYKFQPLEHNQVVIELKDIPKGKRIRRRLLVGKASDEDMELLSAISSKMYEENVKE